MTAVAAKKPKTAQWRVAIPEVPLDPVLDSLNLTGFSEQPESGYAIFEDQGFRGSVRVNVNEYKGESGSNTSFTLLFYPDTSDYGVEIDSVTLGTPSIETDNYCRFPYSCNTYPDCMECLMNGEFPIIDPFYTTKYGFALSVATNEDIEKQDEVGGRLFLYMDAYDSGGQYHSISCDSERKAVRIAKTSNPDQWKITNGYTHSDEVFRDTFLTCKEYYQVKVDENGKKIPPPRWYDQTVMTAETVLPFAFEAIWTKK
jgi:hypothetical protein